MSLWSSKVEGAAAVHARSGNDINDWFRAQSGNDFIDWFNKQCSRKQHWIGQVIGTTPVVKESFVRIWNNLPLIFGKDSVQLIEFCSLMSILVNEVGSTLAPTAELSGLPGSPGLAYCFNAIPGVKRSYNTSPGNRLAGSLFFNDELYWSAHGSRPLGTEVRRRPELKSVWDACVYPQSCFSTSLDPVVTGFVQEADFFKFRGRGFIQMTWRVNYERLVAFIQRAPSEDEVLLRFKTLWADKSPEWVCTTSTNADWDQLFADDQKIVASRGIGLHNEASGHYLNLANDAAVLSAPQPESGSLYRMGLRISGGVNYASLFRNRVIQMVEALPL